MHGPRAARFHDDTERTDFGLVAEYGIADADVPVPAERPERRGSVPDNHLRLSH